MSTQIYSSVTWEQRHEVGFCKKCRGIYWSSNQLTPYLFFQQQSFNGILTLNSADFPLYLWYKQKTFILFFKCKINSFPCSLNKFIWNSTVFEMEQTTYYLMAQDMLVPKLSFYARTQTPLSFTCQCASLKHELLPHKELFLLSSLC